MQLTVSTVLYPILVGRAYYYFIHTYLNHYSSAVTNFNQVFVE